MAKPVFVQTVNHLGTSRAATFTTANITTGNFIVCSIDNLASAVAVSGVSDSAGNVYAKAIAKNDATNVMSAEVWYAPITVGGGTKPTVTVAYVGGGSLNTDLTCYEFSGINNASPLNVAGATSASGATGTALSSTAMGNTTLANCLIVGCCSLAQTVTAGEGGSWVGGATANGNGSEYLIATAVGAYAATFTGSPTGKYVAVVCAFSSTDPVVQSPVQNSGSTATTFPITLATTTTGNMLVALVATASATVSSISSSAGTATFAQQVSWTTGISIWAAPNIVGGTTPVLTVHCASSVGCDIKVYELAGMGTTVQIDGTNHATGSGTAMSSGAITTTANNDFVCALMAPAGTASGGEAGWTADFATGDLFEYIVQTTAGSITGTGTTSSSAWSGVIAAFMPAPVLLAGVATFLPATVLTIAAQLAQQDVLTVSPQTVLTIAAQLSEPAVATVLPQTVMVAGAQLAEKDILTVSPQTVATIAAQLTEPAATGLIPQTVISPTAKLAEPATLTVLPQTVLAPKSQVLHKPAVDPALATLLTLAPFNIHGPVTSIIPQTVLTLNGGMLRATSATINPGMLFTIAGMDTHSGTFTQISSILLSMALSHIHPGQLSVTLGIANKFTFAPRALMGAVDRVTVMNRDLVPKVTFGTRQANT